MPAIAQVGAMNKREVLRLERDLLIIVAIKNSSGTVGHGPFYNNYSFGSVHVVSSFFGSKPG